MDKMRAVVRPPTARTRRKQQEIKQKMPIEVFYEIMSPLESTEVEGFQWLDEATKDALEPTSKTAALTTYKYILNKPALVDKVWDLRSIEERLAAIKRKKKPARWRRGRGASKLHLSMAAAERGDTTSLLSAVTGNVIIKLDVPNQERRMPELKINFNVSTLDTKGHVEWSTSYSAAVATALGKRMKNHLKEMQTDPEYPTHAGKVAEVLALPLTLPAPPAAPLALQLCV